MTGNTPQLFLKGEGIKLVHSGKMWKKTGTFRTFYTFHMKMGKISNSRGNYLILKMQYKVFECGLKIQIVRV